MGSPAAHLALLREVVGPLPSNDLLASAWKRSGGDLAAAVNIVLDAGRNGMKQPAPPASVGSGPVVLDIDDDSPKGTACVDLADRPAFARPMQTNAAQKGQRAPVPAIAVTKVNGNRPVSDAPEAKRQRTGTVTLETPAKAMSTTAKGKHAVEYSFFAGNFELQGFSTKRVAAGTRFSVSGGSRPLLCKGDRLEFRWRVETKKTRGKAPIPDPAAAREGGTIRFDAQGSEIGKFPAFVAKTLVPLLMRGLVDIEVYVGADPPDNVELGSNIPLVVHVTINSSALRSPTQVVDTSTTKPPEQAGSGIDKKKSFQQEEANREALQNCAKQLLQCLKLRLTRSARTEDTAGQQPADDFARHFPCEKTNGRVDDSTEEEEHQEEMSKEAEVQLGSRSLLERSSLPSISPPESIFASKLRPYQAQAVYWMWKQENPTAKMLPSLWRIPPTATSDQCNVGSMPVPDVVQTNDVTMRPLHPMWDEFELPAQAKGLPGRKSCQYIYYHRTTGTLSLDFPDAALAHCRGGILADDMGLGKTVMSLALLALDQVGDLASARSSAGEFRMLEESRATQKPVTNFFSGGSADDGVGGMLVVAPLSLIRQWQHEVKRHFVPGRTPSVYEYHGAGRHCPAEKLRLYGVVMTTYGTLSWEKEDGPLFNIFWRRVILDEAHSIKNRMSRQAHAAFRLRAHCRWCVTGTPLQNSVEEVYALVRFLRVDPWSTWANWRNSISIPLEKGRQGSDEAMNEALDAVRNILQPLLIRRTKNTVDPATGKVLLELPPKHVHLHHLTLSESEREFYDALYNKAKSDFDSLMARGEVRSNYTHILALITKLRQALCHPFLVFARESANCQDLQALEHKCMKEMSGSGMSEKFLMSTMEDVRKGDLSDCPICCDLPEDPTITPCGHIFCRECALKIPNKCGGECPVCRKTGIDKRSLKVLPGASRFPAKLMKEVGGGSEGDRTAAHSTKMKTLLERLREDTGAGRRVVVFSQWTSFLDLIGISLDSASINWQRFDGALRLEDRQKKVDWLSEENPKGNGDGSSEAGRVLLVSLKSGGTGLNLVAACRLYLLDLWWNPAVDEQAIARVHRIGQTREVHVFKFVVRDSIDEDILALQQAKERLLDDALNGGQSSGSSSKLTMDDLKRIFNPCRSSLKKRDGEARPAESGYKPLELSQMSVQEIDQNPKVRPAESGYKPLELSQMSVQEIDQNPKVRGTSLDQQLHHPVLATVTPSSGSAATMTASVSSNATSMHLQPVSEVRPINLEQQQFHPSATSAPGALANTSATVNFGSMATAAQGCYLNTSAASCFNNTVSASGWVPAVGLASGVAQEISQPRLEVRTSNLEQQQFHPSAMSAPGALANTSATVNFGSAAAQGGYQNTSAASCFNSTVSVSGVPAAGLANGVAQEIPQPRLEVRTSNLEQQQFHPSAMSAPGALANTSATVNFGSTTAQGGYQNTSAASCFNNTVSVPGVPAAGLANGVAQEIAQTRLEVSGFGSQYLGNGACSLYSTIAPMTAEIPGFGSLTGALVEPSRPGDVLWEACADLDDDSFPGVAGGSNFQAAPVTNRSGSACWDAMDFDDM